MGSSAPKDAQHCDAVLKRMLGTPPDPKPPAPRPGSAAVENFEAVEAHGSPPSEGGESQRIVRFVAYARDGTTIVETADGEFVRRRSETDWARVDAMTDEDIVAAMAGDPDWEGLEDLSLLTPISCEEAGLPPAAVRVDSDVLDYFRAAAPDPEARINEVLRAHVRERRKAG